MKLKNKLLQSKKNTPIGIIELFKHICIKKDFNKSQENPKTIHDQVLQATCYLHKSRNFIYTKAPS